MSVPAVLAASASVAQQKLKSPKQTHDVSDDVINGNKHPDIENDDEYDVHVLIFLIVVDIILLLYRLFHIITNVYRLTLGFPKVIVSDKGKAKTYERCRVKLDTMTTKGVQTDVVCLPETEGLHVIVKKRVSYRKTANPKPRSSSQLSNGAPALSCNEAAETAETAETQTKSNVKRQSVKNAILNIFMSRFTYFPPVLFGILMCTFVLQEFVIIVHDFLLTDIRSHEVYLDTFDVIVDSTVPDVTSQNDMYHVHTRGLLGDYVIIQSILDLMVQGKNIFFSFYK